jgi:hypothetical protein
MIASSAFMQQRFGSMGGDENESLLVESRWTKRISVYRQRGGCVGEAAHPAVGPFEPPAGCKRGHLAGKMRGERRGMWISWIDLS